MLPGLKDATRTNHLLKSQIYATRINPLLKPHIYMQQLC